MARLKNPETGVVVNVSDDKAARLGSAWERADEAADVKPAAKRAAAKSSDTKSE